MPLEAIDRSYSRDEVKRVLGLSEKQLRSWEKLEFIPAAETFDFSDLLALRTLLGLRTNKVGAGQIRGVLKAIRERLGDVGNPLTELKIYSRGRKIEVQFEGRTMEPLSGQLLLNFDAVEMKKLLSFPVKADDGKPKVSARHRQDAERWFEEGLRLEKVGAPVEEIIAAYRKACELDPESAGAQVNLGTVYFNLRNWKDAEEQYRRAIEIDPKYALAHYNLGNLFDERGERSTALGHYLAALEIQPTYADAQYNVALVYQSIGQPLKAVHHWKLYLKLDPRSSWADIARRELGKLREATVVQGNRQPG